MRPFLAQESPVPHTANIHERGRGNMALRPLEKGVLLGGQGRDEAEGLESDMRQSPGAPTEPGVFEEGKLSSTASGA